MPPPLLPVPFPSMQDTQHDRELTRAPSIEYLGTSKSSNPASNPVTLMQPKHPQTLPPIRQPHANIDRTPQQSAVRSTIFWNHGISSQVKVYDHESLPSLSQLGLSTVRRQSQIRMNDETRPPAFARQTPEEFLPNTSMSSRVFPTSDSSSYRGPPCPGRGEPGYVSGPETRYLAKDVRLVYTSARKTGQKAQAQQAADRPSIPPDSISAARAETFCKTLISASRIPMLERAVRAMLDEGGIPPQQLCRAYLDDWVIPREKGDYDLPLELLLGWAKIEDFESSKVDPVKETSDVDISKAAWNAKGKGEEKYMPHDEDVVFGGESMDYLEKARVTPVNTTCKYWYMDAEVDRDFKQLAKECVHILSDLADVTERHRGGEAKEQLRIIFHRINNLLLFYLRDRLQQYQDVFILFLNMRALEVRAEDATRRMEEMQSAVHSREKIPASELQRREDVDMLSAGEEANGTSSYPRRVIGRRKKYAAMEEDLEETNHHLRQKLAELEELNNTQRLMIESLQDQPLDSVFSCTLNIDSQPNSYSYSHRQLQIRNLISRNPETATPSRETSMPHSDPTTAEEEGLQTPSVMITSATPSPTIRRASRDPYLCRAVGSSTSIPPEEPSPPDCKSQRQRPGGLKDYLPRGWVGSTKHE
ncbi:hypothetical protein IAT40_004669 [Kwoniella sp. CBS 6097]